MCEVCRPTHTICVYIISEEYTWKLLEIFIFPSRKLNNIWFKVQLNILLLYQMTHQHE